MQHILILPLLNADLVLMASNFCDHTNMASTKFNKGHSLLQTEYLGIFYSRLFQRNRLCLLYLSDRKFVHPSHFTFFSGTKNACEKTSFLFLRKELPVRLANIMKEINLLPDSLLRMPSVQLVESWWVSVAIFFADWVWNFLFIFSQNDLSE